METVKEPVGLIETRVKNKLAVTGIESGFTELDKLTSGFQKSELIILGARPSIGKTAFALNMATHIAVDKKIPVGFFTLEMSDTALMQRIISSVAQIDAQSIRNGFLQSSEYVSLVDAASRIADAPFWTVDMPNMNLLDLQSAARQLCTEKKVQIIFIDYIQLISMNGSMNSEKGSNFSEYDRLTQISGSLKSLARELDIPVVALAQLGRSVEKGEEPNLASLKGSGSMEQDADVVMFLHRDRDKAKDKETGQALEAVDTQLILAKQRNGPIGDSILTWKPRYTTFYNREKGNY
jgi:replicative DNA helicase